MKTRKIITTSKDPVIPGKRTIASKNAKIPKPTKQHLASSSVENYVFAMKVTVAIPQVVFHSVSLL